MTITAKVIEDSLSPQGARLTTLQLRYPRFIHSEFMTHRQFSRNASSSRAVPIERMIQDVIDDPALPVAWGSNKPGMQAGHEISYPISLDGMMLPPQEAWLAARYYAVTVAREFAEAGYHKQIANRLLEPFSHISVVVTATDWDNFFTLRLHDDADPTIAALAAAMRIAMDESTPVARRYHTPYVRQAERDQFGANAMWISAARCARVSYLMHDGTDPDWEKDFALSRRLWESKHLSPFEHQATAADGRFANFNCWQSHRNAAGY